MIHGEFETLLNAYPIWENDHFFGRNRSSKPDDPPEPDKAKGGRGREVIKKIGSTVDQLGGYEGIGRAADNLKGMFGRKNQEPREESGGRQIGAAVEQRQLDTEGDQKKNQSVKTWRIVGVVALVVLIGVAVASVALNQVKEAA